MTTSSAVRVELMDFSNIALINDDSAPDIVDISEADGFVLNNKFTNDFRIRKSIYDMMMAARDKLPENYHFMIYESYRPLARQIELWNRATDHFKKEHPGASDKDLHDMTETFVADPYNGIGSGHQACCALDISLCDGDGKEYDMGTQCQEICEASVTKSAELSDEAIKNRGILIDALESVGFINYSSEWWHFSYGDHQWAYLTDKAEAIFGPIDI